MTEQIENLLADVLQFEPQVHQHLRGHPLLFAEQPQQDVLGADVIMVEVTGLLHRILDHLLGPGGLRELAHCHHIGAALNEILDLHQDLPQVDIEVFEDVGRDAAPLLDQAEQDMLRADVFVVKPLSLLVGQLHHLAGTIRESLVHISSFLQRLPDFGGRGLRCCRMPQRQAGPQEFPTCKPYANSTANCRGGRGRRLWRPSESR